MTGPAAGPARRARRHDPGRRDRIIEAALAVIAEHGVAAASHREIARAADVPLGSMTYHFVSLDEVLAEAFTRHAAAVAEVLEERMFAAPGREAAITALAEHISADLLAPGTGLILSAELYAAAARRPALREVTQEWMRRSRAALEQHFDPATARALDALVEGLVLHSALGTDPMTPAQIRAALRRFLDP
ncbi:DNA-binding transcriptional regulator YbjK [Allocatelliglobosispora scoriae]|uniref:DNA-binding transcriptional regulator YbjK n=1 Tax=Allocatelliglobosispora scoriae TaxID=643052 RepID=A0A841BJ48_9ACTN|nr:TetR family transcriptional regulator [Allocatelliglobosispora scoriae]MBB5867073.1 DNA-binding transcriptional regulator YbjK [Allocatelliglobosispora scoriae]